MLFVINQNSFNVVKESNKITAYTAYTLMSTILEYAWSPYNKRCKKTPLNKRLYVVKKTLHRFTTIKPDSPLLVKRRLQAIHTCRAIAKFNKAGEVGVCSHLHLKHQLFDVISALWWS